MIPVADGELHVSVIGDGPPLLLIAGGLGAADAYRALAKHLGGFTIVSYDRRGHFHSSDHTSWPIPVTRHADDVFAVLDHLALGPVSVFGSSAGALIGLDLVSRYPAAVSTLVAHEPPAVQLMPDAQAWLEDVAQQVRLARSGDLMAAFTGFVGGIAGAALPDLRAVRLPNEKEWQFLFDREITEFFDYLPDLRALRKSGVDIVPTAGVGSRGRYHYQPAKVLALELGLPFVESPGAHLAPQRNPAEFAVALRELLS